VNAPDRPKRRASGLSDWQADVGHAEALRFRWLSLYCGAMAS
jgi:hypothetical protein